MRKSGDCCKMKITIIYPKEKKKERSMKIFLHR